MLEKAKSKISMSKLSRDRRLLYKKEKPTSTNLIAIGWNSPSFFGSFGNKRTRPVGWLYGGSGGRLRGTGSFV